jgi:hypothetical protein
VDVVGQFEHDTGQFEHDVGQFEHDVGQFEHVVGQFEHVGRAAIPVRVSDPAARVGNNPRLLMERMAAHTATARAEAGPRGGACAPSIGAGAPNE